jgi:hypothetical protein
VSIIRQRDENELGLRPGSRFTVGQLIGCADHYVDTSNATIDAAAQFRNILAEIGEAVVLRQTRLEQAHDHTRAPIDVAFADGSSAHALDWPRN